MKSVVEQANTCTFCPKLCRHTCPVSNTTGDESLTPGAKMTTLADLLAGRRAWTVEQTAPLWACSSCHACATSCELGVQPGAVLVAARQEATRQNAVPARIENYATRFRLRDERLVQQATREMPDILRATSGAIGLFPGCDTTAKGARSIAALVALAAHAGQSLPLVATSRGCLGYPLLAAGLRDAFVAHARRIAVEWRGFSTVVMNCSACVAVAHRELADEGISLPRVISVADYLLTLAPALQRGSGPTTPRARVFYHDPCHAVRGGQVSDAAREVLRAVADVREFTWHHGEADCCGGAGLLPKTMPQVADSMARDRLRDVAAKGGGLVVTSCGTCSFMLRRNAMADVHVQDLPVAVALALGLDVPEPPLPNDDADEAQD